MKVITKPKQPRIIVVSPLPQILARFKKAISAVSDSLVDRLEEVEAASYCLLTKSHMMLEGKHGTAKSQFANEVFRRIRDAQTFEKMFMKTTIPDEIFGPMVAESYRTRAIWEHNVERMLPTSHFFFADEVYRASGTVLPSLMNILNERKFMNGPVVLQCPLITAIGTTNFTTVDEELDAFHDRWHVKIEVKPLGPKSSVLKMLSRSITPPETAITEENSITLNELVLLQDAVRKVEISREMMELYVALLERLSRELSSVYLSDRRKVVGLKFIQAAALLAGRRHAAAEDLAGVSYVLRTVRNDLQEGAWSRAYSAVIGDYENARTETKDLRKVEDWTRVQEAHFDSEESGVTPRSAIDRKLQMARSGLTVIAGVPTSSVVGTELKEQLTLRLRSLIAKLVPMSSEGGTDNNDDEEDI